MTDTWHTVAEAIATKLAASSGCATAGLRGADTDITDQLAGLPIAKVLEPSMTMIDQTANREEYELLFPVEVIVARPAGRGRSRSKWSAIARAIQEEWWTGQTLGGAVSWSVVVGADHGLTEYDDEARDGCTVTIRAHVLETLASARTS